MPLAARKDPRRKGNRNRRVFRAGNGAQNNKIKSHREKEHKERTRAQESTNAIERLYISMRHLFSRGFYKPMGISGETLRKSLKSLRMVKAIIKKTYKCPKGIQGNP
mgnify:CR=1 FL=1